MPKAIWILVIGMTINVTGASFLWPLNTIYISQELGQSLTVAGSVLMVNAAAGITGNLIGGKLFDRIGGYKTIITGVSITMASAFSLAALHHSFTAYVVLLIGLGFGAGMMVPCMYAFAGAVWPEGGRRPFNAMYVAQNVGVAAGAAIGGLLASVRFDLVFLGNGLMYLSFFILAFFFFKNLQAEGNRASTSNIFEQTQKIENQKRFQSLLLLCAGFLVCWIAYTQWASTISVHTQNLGIPLSYYSLLWTINGSMIIFFQPVIKFFIQRWVHSLKSQIYVGLSIFMVSYLILAQAEVFTAFVAAMIILTIGEMFVWPAVPTIAHQLAPQGKAGFYQGIVNSIGTGGRLIGPFFGGIMADVFGMAALFYVLAGMFSISFVMTKIFDRGVPHLQFTRTAKEKSVS
ncbi:MDR family MFS transporter [Salipaludibacillus aurantiacus]|uniref:Predicted arabinose efflux permease, MFS family n=1 Tax=Salipaludibacillus aurantiacus TaxID=1601833 RepID=A0A1H9WKI7_9BACI|nr:MFS transporter [Salipaludibacillus aurantiacus]SES34259.1 Predicted arabinose efflux permease, MFS family [Salipaludibacillus aurantiacus]